MLIMVFRLSMNSGPPVSTSQSWDYKARDQHWNWQAFYCFVRPGSKTICKVGFTAIQSFGILSLLFSSVMFVNAVNVTRNTLKRELKA